MTLGALLQRLEDNPSLVVDRRSWALDPSRVAHGVAYDSRRVGEGDVFVALKGANVDGMAFAAAAVERGASAVIAEGPRPAELDVPWLTVGDARLALAVVAATMSGDPSLELILVGITGTNGKTTTSYLVEQMFEKAGFPCGRVGTIGYRLGAIEKGAARTTPESSDLQRMLREMVDAGCRAAVLEVSSHALALKRVDHVRFAAAVFTNLSRDHLDFHGDMEAYFRSKRRLFEMLPPGACGIVNADDPRGADLARMIQRPVTFGIETPADVRPADVSVTLDGVAFDVHTPRGRLHARSKLLGNFTVYNILAAVSVGVALDLSFSAIEQGITALERVPGRFEVVSNRSDDVTVIVDFAHTDDALRRLLDAVRPLATRRLITVFGCGGDRDRTKRPLMGAVAARRSDVVFVTSDNPRSEDPDAIIGEIVGGIPRAGGTTALETITDRRTAIERAIGMAAPGDVVVVAGKGHEKYQEIGTRTLRFDDVAVSRDALVQRRTGSRV